VTSRPHSCKRNDRGTLHVLHSWQMHMLYVLVARQTQARWQTPLRFQSSDRKPVRESTRIESSRAQMLTAPTAHAAGYLVIRVRARNTWPGVSLCSVARGRLEMLIISQ
jgi:hypothetical protein